MHSDLLNRFTLFSEPSADLRVESIVNAFQVSIQWYAYENNGVRGKAEHVARRASQEPAEHKMRAPLSSSQI